MDIDHLQFIHDLVMQFCENMEIGNVSDEADIIGPAPWYRVPPSEHRHVFVRPLAMLVAQGELPLEFAGYDSKQRALYRKV